MRCDNDGFDCVKVSSSYRHEYYREDTRYTCDAYGDNCRYEPMYYNDERGYYDSYGDWHPY